MRFQDQDFEFKDMDDMKGNMKGMYQSFHRCCKCGKAFGCLTERPMAWDKPDMVCFSCGRTEIGKHIVDPPPTESARLMYDRIIAEQQLMKAWEKDELYPINNPVEYFP